MKIWSLSSSQHSYSEAFIWIQKIWNSRKFCTKLCKIERKVEENHEIQKFYAQSTASMDMSWRRWLGFIWMPKHHHHIIILLQFSIFKTSSLIQAEKYSQLLLEQPASQIFHFQILLQNWKISRINEFPHFGGFWERLVMIRVLSRTSSRSKFCCLWFYGHMSLTRTFQANVGVVSKLSKVAASVKAGPVCNLSLSMKT